MDSPTDSDIQTPEQDTLQDAVRETRLGNARLLANVLETADPLIGGHTKRVAMLARLIGEKMGVAKPELLDLEIAGLLHDIGKLALPERLQKLPFVELEDNEVAMVNQHPIFAQTALAFSEEYNKVALIIRHHLEYMDGTGHPDGLKGSDIPVAARILGVANAYDELKQRRLFTLEVFSSDHAGEDFAFSFLKRTAGRQHDLGIIETLEKAIGAMRPHTRTEEMTMERLTPGLITGADVTTKDGTLLIAKGVPLGQLHLMRLGWYYKLGLIEREIPIAVEHPQTFP